MYIFKNSINIATTYEEDAIFNECDTIIDNFITVMKENNCDECMSSITGEVICLDELQRMKGILSGLPKITIMYSTK